MTLLSRARAGCMRPAPTRFILVSTEMCERGAANVSKAASIVKKWRARRSWPFTATGVHDGTKVRSLPLDIRVALAMSSPFERTTLAVGLDAAEIAFSDQFWPIVQVRSVVLTPMRVHHHLHHVMLRTLSTGGGRDLVSICHVQGVV